MSFDNIDPSLKKFSEENDISILRENLSPYRRYFYLSNAMSKTVQVVIEPEIDGKIRIDVHSVEEISDEFHLTINDSVEDVYSVIRYAYFISKCKIDNF